jgi:ubiquinone/menaquinone biosynthesis methyltransferase
LTSLRRAFDSPESKHRYVRRLFATIADRYDLITTVLSYGRDARWKALLVSLSEAAAGMHALDVACGTGDLASGLASRGARTVGLDLTPRMVELARAKHGGAVAFLVGDMMALPFRSASFDVVTTGYGLRNVPDLAGAIDEIVRVLRPAGRLLSLDFNRPRPPVVRAVFLGYLTVVGSLLGWLLHGDADTYRYIPASIRRYPGAEGVADLLRARGFADVRILPLAGGLMTLHVAIRG